MLDEAGQFDYEADRYYSTVRGDYCDCGQHYDTHDDELHDMRRGSQVPPSTLDDIDRAVLAKMERDGQRAKHRAESRRH
jgi:hypothetical protein